jgi:hypothetical protein
VKKKKKKKKSGGGGGGGGADSILANVLFPQFLSNGSPPAMNQARKF